MQGSSRKNSNLQGDLKDLSFQIMKNCAGTLIIPNIPSGKKIDSNLLLKSISPSGCIYLQLLEEIVYQDDDMFDRSPFEKKDDDVFQPLNSAHAVIDVDNADEKDDNTNSTTTASTSPSIPTNTSASTSTSAQSTFECPFDIQTIINDAKSQVLTEPVEILRFLQKSIVQGRKIDLSSQEELSFDGETNHITIDRDRILETTFCELSYIKDFRLTEEFTAGH
jgi:hypothetical protein